jgi:hypothetical protein
MRSSLFRRLLVGVVVTAFAVTLAPALPAFAQQEEDDAVAAPPASANAPGPGVARIAAIRGSVTITRADSNETVAAALNAPVLGADYVSTGEGARTELQLDGVTAVRLDENTQMRFTSLAPESRELQIAVGTIDIGVFGDAHRPQIDTPTVSVRPTQSGEYRVTVTQDGQTEVTVRHGAAEVIAPQGNQSIRPGNTLLALGSAENPTISIVQEVATDDFDRYAAARDREIRVALANGNGDPNLQGAADLDQVGRWVTDPTYGRVWVPPTAQDPDWAPYQDGRWAWEDAYGWTWVAAEPWGWAPYHYGRWFHSAGYGWAWYPPARGVAIESYWRPALVGFVGFNVGGVGIGLGFGNIGWVPLAPGEAFHPWYGGGRYGYGGPRNVTNVNVNVTNKYGGVHYRNASFTGGVTAVSRANFQSGNFSARVAVTQAEFRSGGAFNGAPPVVPSRANLGFRQGASASVGLAHPLVQRASYAGNPMAVQRTPFGAQRQAVATAAHVQYTPDERFPVNRPSGFSASSARSADFARPQGQGQAPAAGRYEGGAGTGAAPPSAWDRFNRAPNGANATTPNTGASGYERGAQAEGRAAVPSTGGSPSYASPRNGANGYQQRGDGTTGAQGQAARPSYATGAQRTPRSYNGNGSPGGTAGANGYNRTTPGYSGQRGTQSQSQGQPYRGAQGGRPSYGTQRAPQAAHAARPAVKPAPAHDGGGH